MATKRTSAKTAKAAPAKRAAAKTAPVKAEEVKIEEVKEVEVKEADVKAEEVKVEAVKETEVKEEVKKETVKKAAPAKKEVEPKVVVQFGGQETDMATVIENAKKAYVAEGHRAAAIKEIQIYVKPEEYAAYYVINGVAGRVNLF